MKERISLGSFVKVIGHNIEGIIVSRTDYITICESTYVIKSKDGNEFIFDGSDLEIKKEPSL